ncbi:MAG TPA: S-adenosylmethionine:tRNA ribosyltransferase-isomerase, partial [Casimicrobiaceae bacterium]|nr:S-adenosylmethionine:tRNA ribosyltransferase-isomerase [Casimicrobiaceae bacterium]
MTGHSPWTLDDFDYDLPADLIAQTPAPRRTASRLLHVDGAQLDDLGFADFPRLVGDDDLLVLNDTRVINARIRGRKPTGGDVEML